MLRTFFACLVGTTFAFPALAGDTMQGKSAHGEQAAMVAELSLSGAFSRATLPNQPVGGGFLQITNGGGEDDRLIAVTSAVSGRAEIHEMAMSGDTMKMRELEDGLVIPAGETVTLKPGGYHLMFMDLAGPLVEGERFEATLEFEKAGEVVVPFVILGKGAKAMDHSAHGQGS